MIKPIKIDGIVVGKGQARRGNGELLLNGCRVSVVRDENIRDFFFTIVYIQLTIWYWTLIN